MALNPADARTLLETLVHPVFITDAAGTIQSVNAAFENTTGYPADRAVDQPADLLEPAETSEPSFGSRVEALDGESSWEGRILYRHPEDRSYHVHQTILPVVNGEGTLEGYVVKFLNLTRLVSESNVFQQQALEDEITGLPNRPLVQNRIQHALDELKRDPDRGFTLMFIDLDDFHRIANSLGRETGSQILAMVGERLENRIRPGDTASRATTARFGSDEFVILLEGTQEPSHAHTIIGRLLEGIREPMAIEEHELRVDATAGIVFSSPDYEEPQALIRDADTAMHQARDRGKDYAFFTDTMQDALLHQLRIESDLRRALDSGDFELHYQPILEVTTGNLEGFEALIRWSHPERGLVSPGEFLPEAERSGLIVPLGRWVLEEAVRQLQHWKDEDLVSNGIVMSVNHSPSELAEEEFLDVVEAVLAEHSVPRESLHLEFTETTVAHNVERMDERIQGLAELGLRLCVDDFGSGYSAVERLFRWPIDVLKIDRTFVQGMSDDEQQRRLTRGILEFARRNQFHVIAEGIETADEHELLEEWGCPAAQGYFYARPMSVERVEEYLRTESVGS